MRHWKVRQVTQGHESTVRLLFLGLLTHTLSLTNLLFHHFQYYHCMVFWLWIPMTSWTHFELSTANPGAPALTEIFSWLKVLILQFSSVAQLCLTLCNPMNWIMLGFPVHHQLPEPAQTHILCVSDAIQPSHPLLSLSPAFNLSQRQGLFQWMGSSHQVS